MDAASNDESLLAEIRAYCAEADMKPSTLGLYALGSSRFVDRLERRSAKALQDAEKVRAWMRANPPDARKRAGANATA